MKLEALIYKVIYGLRNFSSRYIFKRISEISNGHVLDVGGGKSFFETVEKRCKFDSWTVLDPLAEDTRNEGRKFTSIRGDGAKLSFSDNYFDTVLNIQVLEHTYDPAKVFSEIVRVLKPGGKAIFLIPQTANLHLAPHHYFNFTPYWVRATVALFPVTLLELRPLGGFCYSMASRLFYFNLQAFRFKGMYNEEFKRPFRFYLFLPITLVVTNLLIFVFLFLSLFDSPDEANNLFFIIQKQSSI